MSGAKNGVALDAIFGASESGKSALMKSETARARPRRLMVWDPKREYSAFGESTESLEALLKIVLRERHFWCVFMPALSRKKMREQFNVFCLAANRARNVRVIADELADVTEPGWAPEGWEIITRQGRHAGLSIQGASQRPADVDKSFYGNCSRLVVFRLNAEGDLDRMAKTLGTRREELANLAPLEYYERNMRTGAVDRKKLTPKELARIPA